MFAALRQTPRPKLLLAHSLGTIITYDVLADPSTNRLSVGVFDELSKDYGLRRIELSNASKVADLR